MERVFLGVKYWWYVGCVCFFCKSFVAGVFYGIFLGRVNGCELGLSDVFSLVNFECIPDG